MTNIGARLREIRESIGLKLTEASGMLGFSNYQTLSSIEEGKREVKAAELLKFSQVYYCSIDKLLGRESIDSGVSFVWRNPPRENKSQIERDILNKCEQYKMLENLLGISAKEDFIRVSIEDISIYNKVQNMASQVSKLLGLGRRPAFSLQKVLEQDYGIKVLYYSFREGSAVSTFSPALGRVLVINKDEAPWRQNYDLAHELFHLITWEAVVVNQKLNDNIYSSDIEKKADQFASILLLPEDEVRKEIMERAEASRNVSFSDVVDIAIEFGVSTQALIYRLTNLKFISFETADALVKDAALTQMSKQKRIEQWQGRESEQFINLAIRCLRKGLISRGKFAEFAEIDRSDIDNYISQKGLLEEEGSSIEIMAS